MTIHFYGYGTKLRSMKTKEHKKNGQNYVKIIKPHVPELFGNNLYTIVIFLLFISYILQRHINIEKVNRKLESGGDPCYCVFKS